MNKKWEYNNVNNDEVNRISIEYNISKLVAKILVKKGITNDNDIKIFLNLIFSSVPKIMERIRIWIFQKNILKKK